MKIEQLIRARDEAEEIGDVSEVLRLRRQIAEMWESENTGYKDQIRREQEERALASIKYFGRTW